MARLGDGDGTEERRDELAERLDLDLDRRLGALSKGNRQKVGVIYAFQHQPDVLILDEPTIGLDPLVSQTVLELIREAAHGGVGYNGGLDVHTEDYVDESRPTSAEQGSGHSKGARESA